MTKTAQNNRALMLKAVFKFKVIPKCICYLVNLKAVAAPLPATAAGDSMTVVVIHSWLAEVITIAAVTVTAVAIIAVAKYVYKRIRQRLKRKR
ncbi:hypothetical protein [Lacticaseibacillus rhamnosus]|uniref:hypothetical protein n=1 Tax=Lacticaseibacillus rhamnosus TaxID=47715 RepID=UPI001F4C64DE|nr:hypothetical protein [Lacticaseibacillus rhamnosus]